MKRYVKYNSAAAPIKEKLTHHNTDTCGRNQIITISTRKIIFLPTFTRKLYKYKMHNKSYRIWGYLDQRDLPMRWTLDRLVTVSGQNAFFDHPGIVQSFAWNSFVGYSRMTFYGGYPAGTFGIVANSAVAFGNYGFLRFSG